MSLPKQHEGIEEALNIVSEIVSTGTGIPGAGSVAIGIIKAVCKRFPKYTLKKILDKKTVKDLGIPDDKYDFVYANTRDALSSINSVDYNPAVFRKDIFTKNKYSPISIGTALVDTLHIDEDSDLIKAVRFVLAVYLLHWTEEPDFPLETRQELLKLKSDEKKDRVDITSLKTRVKKLEDSRTDPLPAELTVIPKSITTLIGRESDIQDITSKIETDHILCITADGGLGKTAIAKNIINSIRNDIGKDGCKYKYVAWLTSSGILKEDLLQIRIPNYAMDDQEEKHKYICRFLQCNPSFIVIDNLDEFPTPEEIDMLNTITGESTVLITTRATIDFFPTFELKPLDRDASVALFYNHYFHNSTITCITHKKIQEEINTGRINDVYKIIDATGRNALIIELIAKTSHADVLSVSELWESISSGIFGFKSKTEIRTDHSGKYPESNLPLNEQMRKLYSMLNLTDKQKEILSFISLFPAEHDIFSNAFKWAGFFDQGANDMIYLVDRGWIDREENYYSIHTIVRDSINLQNRKSGNSFSIHKYERLIKELSDVYGYIPRTTDYNLAQKLSFVPKTVGKLLSEFDIYNTTIGLFFNNLGCLYQDQGNYDESMRYYIMALEIREKTLGRDHPSTAITYNNLAGLYQNQGNFDSALKYYKIANDICEKTLGRDHPSTATTYNNIASVYKAQGNFDEALKFYKMTLEIDEKTQGKDHPSTATTYNNMAGVYRDQGNYDESLRYYNMALEISEKTRGRDHPYTATTYNNLAGLYQDQGKFNEALKHYKMALEIREKILGRDHPETATIYNNLAGLYQYQGNYGEALKYYKIALEICEKTLGRDHPSTSTTYNNMACIYRGLGNYDKSLKYCKIALEIDEKTLGKDHPSTATTYNNLAGLYQDQGNYDESLRYYNMALEIRKKTLGRDHPSTATTYDSLAGVYRDQGNYNKSLQFYKMALEIREKTLGKDHPSTAITYNNIAVLYRAQGNYERALYFYRMALDICEKRLGRDHPSIATTYNNLAVLYRDQGNFEEALKYYKMALEINKKTLDKDHPETATIYNNLAGLYQYQGNYGEALKYYKMALEIREKRLGIHLDTANTHDELANLYHIIGNLEEAKTHFEKAVEILKKLNNK